MNNTFTNIAKLATGQSEFTYKEMKKQCIIRGMPFKDAVGADVPNLSNWLLRHVGDKEDITLLDKYDDWLDDKLLHDGNDYLIHPSLRLGYIGQKGEQETSLNTKVKKEVKEKVLKEKDTSGLYKGTKKQYTFDLQRRGKSIEQTIIKVTRKFPEAKIKSIKIWFNRSRKENG